VTDLQDKDQKSVILDFVNETVPPVRRGFVDTGKAGKKETSEYVWHAAGRVAQVPIGGG